MGQSGQSVKILSVHIDHLTGEDWESVEIKAIYIKYVWR
jgi:hypothetical protein